MQHILKPSAKTLGGEKEAKSETKILITNVIQLTACPAYRWHMTKQLKKVFGDFRHPLCMAPCPTPSKGGTESPVDFRKDMLFKEEYLQHTREVTLCTALINSSEEGMNKTSQAILTFDVSEKGKDKPTEKLTR